MQVIRAAVALIVRSMVLSARSAGQQRLLLLQQAIAASDTAGELARLRDENRRLESESRLLKARFDDVPTRKHYTLRLLSGFGTPLTALRLVSGPQAFYHTAPSGGGWLVTGIEGGLQGGG